MRNINRNMENYEIPSLPLAQDLETKVVLKQVIKANKMLAELKGTVKTIPNQSILVNTLILQESKDSSAIEQIVTTHDELFKYDVHHPNQFSLETKEVQYYASALHYGFGKVQKTGVITSNLLIDLVKIITKRDKGFRNTPGTTLKTTDGKVVYTPPQKGDDVILLMENLISFINETELSTLDPLIKVAIIHHQFESIHPFYDGNGRTGRILCVLFMILEKLLDIPILYLSRYIILNKEAYYRLLQAVRDEGKWEAWILFMLKAVEYTASDTMETVKTIKKLMSEFKIVLKRDSSKIYSHELINTIFSHPYTKIEYVSEAVGVNRQTASRHLKQLEKIGLVTSYKHGRTLYYVNTQLLAIFTKLK